MFDFCSQNASLAGCLALTYFWWVLLAIGAVLLLVGAMALVVHTVHAYKRKQRHILYGKRKRRHRRTF